MSKKIIITGHSKGIGKKLAEYFVNKGHIVYGISRTKSSNKKIHQFKCDIENSKKIKEIFNKINKFDILINNTSISSFSKDPYKNFRKIINTNLIGTFNCCQRSTNHIKGGSIINIASINAHMAFPNNPGYVSSKGGVKSLTQSLALDYAKYNIRVNSVSPGYINEGMSSKSFKNKEKKKERLNRMVIKRWGKAEDLFGIIDYLISSKSSYVTGQDFLIDGGWTIKGL